MFLRKIFTQSEEGIAFQNWYIWSYESKKINKIIIFSKKLTLKGKNIL